MQALGINLGFFLFQVFNFAIVVIILYALAYKPITRLLDNRKRTIAQSLEDARIAADARSNAEEEAARIIAEAKSKAASEVSEASVKADKSARDIIAQAELEVLKIRDEATTEAAVERDRILSEVRGQIAALAMAATQKLLGEALDERKQHVLINEFFSGVREGRVIVLEDLELKGKSAEVTSALPLTDEEQAKVKSEVLSKLGDMQSTVSFRVDPSILGGLLVRVGDKVIDGSISGQLETLRQTIR
jgi:F-type H+-transporting ATPase subunit b